MNGNAKTNQSPSESNRRDRDGLHKRRGVWHYKLKIAGRWRESSTRTTHYREARRIREEAIEAQKKGRLPNDLAKWPFEKAAGQWLAGREKLVAHQTHRIDKERLNALLKVFGGRRLCDITDNDVRTYQINRLDQVGPRTINLDIKVLRMVLRSAKLWSRIAEDYKPLSENKRGPGRALSTEEEKRLFEVASSNPQWDVAYYAGLVAANTTARGCEIKGLRRSDVDLISRTMTIRRASTKTDAGCRVIPLNDTASWALVRLLERARLLGATEPEHYLFPAFKFRHTREGKPHGTGYDPTAPMQTWRSAWRSLTKEAGLPGLRFHDLRHHAITRMAEAGVPEQTLMSIAGHRSRDMVDLYSHIRIQPMREAVAVLEPPKSPIQDQEAPVAVV